MRVVCRCGSQILSSLDERQCVKCGVPCCSSCVFAVEAATYCARCAESVLDAGGAPLSAQLPASHVPLAGDGPWHTSGPPAGNGDSVRWLILVARDQSDLYGHLVRAFSRDDKVQILMDRRKDYSRNPPGMEERLRIHGAAVIRRRASC